MAYGQTGTGKTYTVGRLGKNDAAERGIMVRALEDVIANVNPSSDIVEISYLQVLKFSCYIQPPRKKRSSCYFNIYLIVI